MIVVYVILTAVFFSGLFYYLVNYSLVPYDENFNLDIQNLIIVSSMLIICIALIFAFFHLIIDKLFFRRFYEPPKVFIAIRRGTILGMVLVGLAWLKIFEFWEWHIIVLIPLLGILFEAFFMSFRRCKDSYGKDEENSTEEKE